VSRTRRSALGLGVVGLSALALVLLMAPLAPQPSHSSGLHAAATGASPSVTANVVFQGSSVSSHGTAGSAIVTSFGGAFTTVYYWNATVGSALVTQAFLTLKFFGATVGTSSQSISGAVPETSGQINLSSDFSQNKYLFEGVYQLEAILLDHGQSLFSTTFYVWIQAPYHLTVVNIALVLIGGYEIFQIAALGSVRVARKQLGLEPAKKEVK
jgi:hypothetical protein